LGRSRSSHNRIFVGLFGSAGNAFFGSSGVMETNRYELSFVWIKSHLFCACWGVQCDEVNMLASCGTYTFDAIASSRTQVDF
jgi:hypothetical protein